MNDSVLLLISLCVGVAGLILLFFLSPPGSENYTLQGTVIAGKGRQVTVQTNVTLATKNISAHEWKVFWAGDKFVSVD